MQLNVLIVSTQDSQASVLKFNFHNKMHELLQSTQNKKLSLLKWDYSK